MRFDRFCKSYVGLQQRVTQYSTSPLENKQDSATVLILSIDANELTKAYNIET